MVNVSFRDLSNPNKFSLSPYTADLSLSEIKELIILLAIHGYNNDASESMILGKTMKAFFEPSPVCIINVSWPSNGNTLEYTSDRFDAMFAGPRLAQLIADLNRVGKRVSAVPHSMGNYVLMNALPYLRPGELHNIYSLAADIATKECTPTGKWGKHASKMNQAHFYYSKTDIVLGLVSRLRHIFSQNRVGFYGLPEKHPENWFEIDANMRFGREKISHSGYFEINQLWAEIFDKEING